MHDTIRQLNVSMRYRDLASLLVQKGMSEVGFEPTPTFVDQNTHSATILQRRSSLESGALDRSAILTTVKWRLQCQYLKSRSLNNSPFEVDLRNGFDGCHELGSDL